MQDLLSILAAETRDLVAIAQDLDNEIPNVIAQLTRDATYEPQALQAADTLLQHLQDIEHTLTCLATQSRDDNMVNTTTLLTGLRLDYFKRRITKRATSPPQESSGIPQLF